MMNNTKTIIHKRINISLPEDTLALVDRIAVNGKRSHLIVEAVRFYVEKKGQENLKELLKEGAIARTQRSTELAQDWFVLEEEACQKNPR